MKLPLIPLAFACAAFCGSAFAQTAAPANSAAGIMSAPVNPPSPSAQAGQWSAPYGQPVAGKTRAEVYQELIQAEQDGQEQYLNSELYSHG
ncbi:DUF4148 domain-containing protein [Paraburkholderia sp.]|jgi:hypothetical protein|uniref:DUF4148 domain-containing protein n=1 Tax=Paraburkholderia sp. TaxID=1926495 RepID=UPI002F42505E